MSAALNSPVEAAAYMAWKAAEVARVSAPAAASSSPGPPPPAPLPFVVPTSVTATIAAALELLLPAAAEFIDANPIDKKESDGSDGSEPVAHIQ